MHSAVMWLVFLKSFLIHGVFSASPQILNMQDIDSFSDILIGEKYTFVADRFQRPHSAIYLNKTFVNVNIFEAIYTKFFSLDFWIHFRTYERERVSLIDLMLTDGLRNSTITIGLDECLCSQCLFVQRDNLTISVVEYPLKKKEWSHLGFTFAESVSTYIDGILMDEGIETNSTVQSDQYEQFDRNWKVQVIGIGGNNQTSEFIDAIVGKLKISPDSSEFISTIDKISKMNLKCPNYCFTGEIINCSLSIDYLEWTELQVKANDKLVKTLNYRTANGSHEYFEFNVTCPKSPETSPFSPQNKISVTSMPPYNDELSSYFVDGILNGVFRRENSPVEAQINQEFFVFKQLEFYSKSCGPLKFKFDFGDMRIEHSVVKSKVHPTTTAGSDDRFSTTTKVAMNEGDMFIICLDNQLDYGYLYKIYLDALKIGPVEIGILEYELCGNQENCFKYFSYSKFNFNYTRIIKKWEKKFVFQGGFNFIPDDMIIIQKNYFFYWINKGGEIDVGRTGSSFINSYISDYKVLPNGEMISLDVRFQFEVKLDQIPCLYKFKIKKSYYNPGTYDISVSNIDHNVSMSRTVTIVDEFRSNSTCKNQVIQIYSLYTCSFEVKGSKRLNQTTEVTISNHTWNLAPSAYLFFVDELKFKSVVGEQNIIPSDQSTVDKKIYLITNPGFSNNTSLVGFQLLFAEASSYRVIINIKIIRFLDSANCHSIQQCHSRMEHLVGSKLNKVMLFEVLAEGNYDSRKANIGIENTRYQEFNLEDHLNIYLKNYNHNDMIIVALEHSSISLSETSIFNDFEVKVKSQEIEELNQIKQAAKKYKLCFRAIVEKPEYKHTLHLFPYFYPIGNYTLTIQFELIEDTANNPLHANIADHSQTIRLEVIKEEITTTTLKLKDTTQIANEMTSILEEITELPNETSSIIESTTHYVETTSKPVQSNNELAAIVLDTFQNVSHVDFEHLDIADTLILLRSDDDLHGCLSNCSNRGRCALNDKKKLSCVCDNKFVTGDACEEDTRPCSKMMCLNNGTCENLIQDDVIMGFDCTCQKHFYGKHCEKKINVCKNVTCSYQGSCFDNSSIAQCNCFKHYSGDSCEIKSDALLTIKKITSFSLAVALIMIFGFISIIVTIDLIRFYSWLKNN